jgi:hypothetical protein
MNPNIRKPLANLAAFLFIAAVAGLLLFVALYGFAPLPE